MLNNMLQTIRKYGMISPGDTVTCAVSGGADSMAMLWGMYLLRDKLDFELRAVHFNHHLRGEESQRDEDFVREFCGRFDIPLTLGGAEVTAGKKGLEAAAREARYGFFATVPGKISTAHTADDNAETILMHLVRGTGLKGLGGIAPVNGRLIRPMLQCTRQEILAFLEEYHIRFVEDSSNGSDAFLRNRIRHGVMPLLKAENPRFSLTVSQMAMSLREDSEVLEDLASGSLPEIPRLRLLPPAVRARMLERFLKENGIREPEREHIALTEALIFSEKPSARANLPGGLTVHRNYDTLTVSGETEALAAIALPMQGSVILPRLGLRIITEPAGSICNTKEIFTVAAGEKIQLRQRQAGDSIRLNVGSQSLKKLFIDRKIPAAQRCQIPVIADEKGVLGVYGVGANVDRLADSLPALQIRFEKIDNRATF